MKKSQKNIWVEITLPIDEKIEESISNFFFELGCSGCHTENDILHSYFGENDWNQSKHKRLKKYLGELQALGFGVEIDKIKINRFAERDWNEEWKKTYKPFEIARKVLIKPSWLEVQTDPDKIVVEIDPQMAFGTGTHATTQLIVQFLLKQKKAFNRILDIGAGTGILSIVAAKIFPAKIFAFDIDPVAAKTAQSNAAKNKVGDKIHFFCSDRILNHQTHFDLILANINRSIIESMIEGIEKTLVDGGIAIFSGILIEEKEKFYRTLSQSRLRPIEELTKDEWIGILAQKEG